MKNTIETVKTRSFGGLMNGFKSKDNRNLQKKNLKAYLKGAPVFRHGFNSIGKPNWFKTSEVWK